jgi:histidyl-tRNA synthetase
LYKEVCELLWKKSLDNTIEKYIDELKNPSWFAKLSSALNKKNNDKKIESLKSILEKIQSLRPKLSNLDRQINDFQNKKKDELVKIASEFCVIEEFIRIDNTNVCPSFTMADQDKWLSFMRNN